MKKKYSGLEIAIVGISGQFPKSSDYRELWKNLVEGNDLMHTFSEEELKACGIPEATSNDENFIKSQGVLENKGNFDNAFFDYTPDEARIMDPQIRLLHENCWRALEDAGYVPPLVDRKLGFL